MVIWLSVFIPLIGIAVLYWKFQRKITWWELLIMAVTPVALTAGSKALIETVQVQDTEYWGSWVTTSQYWEHWDEMVSCRHPIPCSHPEYSTDSNGKRYQSGYKHSNDGYYHLYDVDDHPPEWHILTSLGMDFEVSQSEFERLAVQFGNRQFVNLHRRHGMGGYYKINGNRFDAIWQGERVKLEPVTTSHSYENRIKASSSTILKRPPVPIDRVAKLYAYPRIGGHQQRCVLGAAGPTTAGGEKKLAAMNAAIGRSKQVRVFTMIFKNEPVGTAMDQEAHWVGGNKNELNVCIGVDDSYEVQWAHVFSWSKSENLKAEIKTFLEGQKQLDLEKFADWLEPAIMEGWTRRNFHEFEYITVDPPTWAVITTMIVTLLVVAGIAVWSIMNEEDSTLSSETLNDFARRKLPWLR